MAKEAKNKEKKVKSSKQSKGKSSFVKDTKAELKKVIWPNFKQLTNNTLAVISVVIIIGVIVFVLDVCFDKINSLGVDKLKEVVQSNETVNEEIDSEELDTDESEDQTENSEETVETVESTDSEEDTTTETETQE